MQKFIQAEEQNFSLFNYVNDLNNEIEKLEEQVAEMKQEKELIHGQGASASSQHEQIIAELEVCDRRLQQTGSRLSCGGEVSGKHPHCLFSLPTVQAQCGE